MVIKRNIPIKNKPQIFNYPKSFFRYLDKTALIIFNLIPIIIYLQNYTIVFKNLKMNVLKY